MKKLVFAALLVCGFTTATFAQNPTGKKGIVTTEVNNTDEQTQNYLRQSNNGAAAVKVDEVDCAEDHSGTILFCNKTDKDMEITLVDVKNNDVKTVAIPTGKSVYMKHVEMGEYFYKNAADKKSKKKNIVNVIECTLKTVFIEKKL